MYAVERFDKFGKIIVDFRSVGLTIYFPLQVSFVLITYASLFSVFSCAMCVFVCVFVSMSAFECFVSVLQVTID